MNERHRTNERYRMNERYRTNERHRMNGRHRIEAPTDQTNDWGVSGGSCDKVHQQCDAGRLLSRKEWKQMDASEITRRGGSLAAFGWNLMDFIPNGRVCKQNSLCKKSAAQSALTTPLFFWFQPGFEGGMYWLEGYECILILLNSQKR